MTRREMSEADVLDAFAMEPRHDRETLERYMRDFPEHASALCELSFELNRTDLPARELDDDDEFLVARAWSDRVASYGQAANPLASLDVNERRALASKLGVKLQVMALFRSGGIIVSSVPEKFLAGFAALLETSADALKRGLSVQGPSVAQAYKSDERPKRRTPITFEQALQESGAGDDEIAALMDGG